MLCEHNDIGYNPFVKEDFVKGQAYSVLQPISQEDWEMLETFSYNIKPGLLMSVSEQETEDGKGKKVIDFMPPLCNTCVPIIYEKNIKVRAFSLKTIWIHVPFTPSLPVFKQGNNSKKQQGKDILCKIPALPDEEISFVKLKITQEIGLDPFQQQLLYRDQILENGKQLSSYLVVDQ